MNTCKDCGKPLDHGNRQRCDECQEKRHAEMAKIRYERCKADGICTHCRKRPAMPGKRKCKYCAEKALGRARQVSENDRAKIEILRKFGYEVKL